MIKVIRSSLAKIDEFNKKLNDELNTYGKKLVKIETVATHTQAYIVAVVVDTNDTYFSNVKDWSNHEVS